MNNALGFMTGNLVLDLSILAWAVAQVLKVVIESIQKRTIDLRLILSSGGMPSSHSALVCACAASVGMLEGWKSTLFALAAVMAVIVMYDASNVRRAAGEQAKVLNYMMDHWAEIQPALFNKDLKELLGHTPVQVLAGSLLGLAIGLLGPIFIAGVSFP